MIEGFVVTRIDGSRFGVVMKMLGNEKVLVDFAWCVDQGER